MQKRWGIKLICTFFHGELKSLFPWPWIGHYPPACPFPSVYPCPHVASYYSNSLVSHYGIGGSDFQTGPWACANWVWRMAKASADLQTSYWCLFVVFNLPVTFGKVSAVTQSAGISQLTFRSDNSVLRWDYQQENIQIPNLVSMGSVDSDLKQICGKAAIVACFSPKVRMGTVSSFVVFSLIQWKSFFLCANRPQKLFCYSKCSQNAKVSLKHWNVIALQQVSPMYLLVLFVAVESRDARLPGARSPHI